MYLQTMYISVGYLLAPLEDGKAGNFLSRYVILYDYINGLSLVGLETVVQTLFSCGPIFCPFLTPMSSMELKILLEDFYSAITFSYKLNLSLHLSIQMAFIPVPFFYSKLL